MTKMKWESRRAEWLMQEASGLERANRMAARRARARADAARAAAARVGVRSEPRTPSRDEVCAWLDEIMTQKPRAPWLYV